MKIMLTNLKRNIKQKNAQKIKKGNDWNRDMKPDPLFYVMFQF